MSIFGGLFLNCSYNLWSSDCSLKLLNKKLAHIGMLINCPVDNRQLWCHSENFYLSDFQLEKQCQCWCWSSDIIRLNFILLYRSFVLWQWWYTYAPFLCMMLMDKYDLPFSIMQLKLFTNFHQTAKNKPLKGAVFFRWLYLRYPILILKQYYFSHTFVCSGLP